MHPEIISFITNPSVEVAGVAITGITIALIWALRYNNQTFKEHTNFLVKAFGRLRNPDSGPSRWMRRRMGRLS